ncbi:MAG: hypothetical protein ACOYO1_02525 [Bacteroidales bacterium]
MKKKWWIILIVIIVITLVAYFGYRQYKKSEYKKFSEKDIIVKKK